MDMRGNRRKPATCADLAAQVCLLSQLIRNAPEDKLQPSLTPQWGAREILIHLVFWHQQYVDILKSLWEDKKPELLRGTFKSINERCIQQYSTCTTEELVASLEKSQRVLTWFSQLDDARALRFSFREGSKKWLFPEFIEAITQHICRHRLQVEKLLAANSECTRPAMQDSGVARRLP